MTIPREIPTSQHSIYTSSMRLFQVIASCINLEIKTVYQSIYLRHWIQNPLLFWILTAFDLKPVSSMKIRDIQTQSISCFSCGTWMHGREPSKNTTYNSASHTFVQRQNTCKALKGEIDPYFWKREVYKESISKL